MIRISVYLAAEANAKLMHYLVKPMYTFNFHILSIFIYNSIECDVDLFRTESAVSV